MPRCPQPAKLVATMEPITFDRPISIDDLNDVTVTCYCTCGAVKTVRGYLEGQAWQRLHATVCLKQSLNHKGKK